MKSYEPQTKSAFGEELAKLRHAKNLTLEKVAAATKIQIRYLERLEQGDFAKLPPDVYARGMIEKYARTVDAEPEELWRHFADERKTREGEGKVLFSEASRQSGLGDRLPKNRFLNASLFVLTPKWATIFSLVAILLFISGYFIFQLEYLVGPPTLVVFEPAGDMLVGQKELELSGRAEAGVILTINGREASVGDDGRFTEKIELQLGVNPIEFQAKNHLGKTAIIKRMVIWQATTTDSGAGFEAAAPASLSPIPQPLKPVFSPVGTPVDAAVPSATNAY